MKGRGVEGLRYGSPREVIRSGQGRGRGEGNDLSAGQEAANQKGQSGFTLLEVVVAMVLVAMVTLTVGFAFKVGIGAWERGTKEGEDPQIRMVIPSLIHRQMASVVKINPFVGATQSLAFCGDSNGLSFFTSYAPEGSPRQGLMRVTYVYDEEEQTLSLYEQLITEKESFEEEPDPLSPDSRESMTPISKTGDIKVFELSYGAGGMDFPLKEDDWKEEWACDSAEWPDVIRLRFQPGEGPRSRSGSWVFRPGILGLQPKEGIITQGGPGSGDTGTPESGTPRTLGRGDTGIPQTLGRGETGTRRQGDRVTRGGSRIRR